MTTGSSTVSPCKPDAQQKEAPKIDADSQTNGKQKTEVMLELVGSSPPSMTTALLVYWVLPVYWLAVYSYFVGNDSDDKTETSVWTRGLLIALVSMIPPGALVGFSWQRGHSTTDGTHVIQRALETVPPAVSASKSTDATINKNVFLFWILPAMLVALFSRYTVDVSDPFPGIETKFEQAMKERQKQQHHHPQKIEPIHSKAAPPSQSPSIVAQTPTVSHSRRQVEQPTSYQDLVRQIKRRRRKVHMASSSSSASTAGTSTGSVSPKKEAAQPTSSESPPATRSASRDRDPARARLDQKIEELRRDYKTHPNDVYRALAFADALRQKDVLYHDGGSGQVEALETYQRALEMTLFKRKALMDAGEPTNVSLSGTTNVHEELLFEYSQKSTDGLLCSIYTNMGKQYFMANMFEKAAESYTHCIDLEPLYLDAVGSRGTTLIILGRYDEAGRDLSFVVEHDTQRFFYDAFTGLAKVLAAKEDAVPGGWESMISILNALIPELEGRQSAADNENIKRALAETLARLHHVMFMYHDAKTNDTDAAWNHLNQGYKHKMSALPPFNRQFEKQKQLSVMQIFKEGFWPQGIGSPSQVPIFIVGFVRSGSTLLERVLDAHPQIVGMGEDSVFNGRLDHIRNSIVDASMTGSTEMLHSTVRALADDVVDGMRERWKVIDANTEKAPDEKDSRAEPERFVDKMLTNYNNIGFVHMLFPNALILHVAREPMDTIFSAFKHEFPPGTLDYTSEFSSLAFLYHGYRDIMEHWDRVLPGRVTHVRYEDMVHDMPGMAKAIIDAAKLEWDEDVLKFHKKKHAVNTLSTTQVRKGVYKDSLQSWKRYEPQLQPLVELIGDRVKWDLQTTLPAYVKPETPDDDEA